MTQTILFDPLIPVWAIFAVGLAFSLFLVLAVWRGLGGWWLRGASGAALLIAIANPALQRENREALSDIVIMVVDETASQGLSDRPAQTAEAVERLTSRIETIGNVELRTVVLRDAAADTGTALMGALTDAMAAEPRGRLAGAMLITDGRVHDIAQTPEMPAPLHVILTGRSRDWDRRLIVRNAPAFAILDEEITLTLRIEDQGAAPGSDDRAPLDISVDGGPPQRFIVPLGVDHQVPFRLPHGGLNVIQFTVPPVEGELTDRNNSAVVQINGVRDRLRVLLVSGAPHAGERTWRNLLKSDSAVDLVHFTILRPPEKQDGVPISELSLISFPTRELFLEKIDEFDLIIFDRYKRRGILPALYLDNVRQYVQRGGAVLVAAGPDFASADSLYRSPLSEVLPASPTSRVIETGFKPEISEVGRRHPVTAGLETFASNAGWGRWLRLVELEPKRGHAVMTGPDGTPLLVLDRAGAGRIALLGSDHAWLWGRGYEGGGPQLELLRRLAHWMMKEPDLEEDALSLSAQGQSITITRRLLEGDATVATVTEPDGTTVDVPLIPAAPGQFTAVHDASDMGLYRVREGEREAVIAIGPAASREFEQTVATDEILGGAVSATRGGVRRIEEGVPAIRVVREGRVAAGRGWIGITPRRAYLTTDLRLIPLVSAWVFLVFSAALMIGAWLREGRR
ncbi:MAG: hypothetical protein AAF982_11895 [Pseudomonadota bacterium]